MAPPTRLRHGRPRRGTAPLAELPVPLPRWAVAPTIGPERGPPPGARVAEVSFQVPFHDVDAMQVVWHGNYLKYFELARTEMERSMDLGFDRVE